jgi:uncharacterized protein YprB with RNaseH-like and TPR domain
MTSSSPSPEKVLPEHAADHKDSTKDERTGEDFGGRIIENPEGSFVHRTTVSTAVRTDDPVYSDYLKEGSCWWTRLEDGFSLGDVVFLDTETTGLFGGAGSLAFLIGIGCFTEKGLIIEQYLMRDFDEEYPMLKSLLDRLKEFRVLVTFNGKSFDWPLLESRFIFSRLKATDWEDRHIDLLHLSRRLWSRCLENCSLSTIEKGILGLYREDDIPGYMIPKVYLEYLNTGDPAEMRRVLKLPYLHNVFHSIDAAVRGRCHFHIFNNFFPVFGSYSYFHPGYGQNLFGCLLCIAPNHGNYAIRIIAMCSANHLPGLPVPQICYSTGIYHIDIGYFLKTHNLIAISFKLLLHGLGVILICLTT